MKNRDFGFQDAEISNFLISPSEKVGPETSCFSQNTGTKSDSLPSGKLT